MALGQEALWTRLTFRGTPISRSQMVAIRGTMRRSSLWSNDAGGRGSHVALRVCVSMASQLRIPCKDKSMRLCAGQRRLIDLLLFRGGCAAGILDVQHSEA